MTAGSPPAVSAIIICLNGEAFIEEAIESVRNQTFADWELIVVDDGSTDGTAAIVENAMGSDARIRLVAHPGNANCGMSASRNLGMAQAAGRYIAFLDADDVWLPNKTADQLAILSADQELAMVYGRTEMWHSWRTGRKSDDFFYDLGVAPGQAYGPPVLFNLLMMNRYQSPSSCGTLIRRDVAQAAGGFDPEFRGMFEDQLFYARLLAQYRVHVDDRCWARYRQHENSHSSQEKARIPLRRTHLRYLRATEAYLKSRGIGDRSMHRALKRAQWYMRAKLAAAYLRSAVGR